MSSIFSLLVDCCWEEEAEAPGAMVAFAKKSGIDGGFKMVLLLVRSKIKNSQ